MPINVYMKAARSLPRSEPTKSHPFRPRAITGSYCSCRARGRVSLSRAPSITAAATDALVVSEGFIVKGDQAHDLGFTALSQNFYAQVAIQKMKALVILRVSRNRWGFDDADFGNGSGDLAFNYCCAAFSEAGFRPLCV
jgi:hypothetical protein